MFSWKRRLAFLAVPGAAALMLGGVVVAHAQDSSQNGGVTPNTSSQTAEPAETPDAVGAVEATGPEVGGNEVAGTDSGPDNNSQNDGEFDGQQ